jgi:phosphoglycolate phosphatase
MKKTHVLFDFDGTLVDSAPAILTTFAQVLQAHGLQACCSIDDSLIGPPLRQTLQTLCGSSDVQLLDTLASSFRDIYDMSGHTGLSGLGRCARRVAGAWLATVDRHQ